jgi:hypothetical protein
MQSTSADEVTDRGTPPRAIRLRHVTAACWTHPLVYSANGLAHACRSSRRRHRTHLRGAACRQQKASTAARIGDPRSCARPLLLAAGDRINVSVCDTGALRMPAIAGDFRAGTISTGRVSGGLLGHEGQMAETRFPLISAIWLVVLSQANLNPIDAIGASSGAAGAQVPERRKPVTRRIPVSTQDRVVKLYMLDRSSREIATELHIGRSTVLKILKMRGVELRPRGNPRRERALTHDRARRRGF